MYIQRRIDKAIESYVKRYNSWKDYGLTTHGNRLIAALVFEALPVTKFKIPTFDPELIASTENLTKLVDERVMVLHALLEKHYPNSIIPTLFKNLKKCEHLAKEARIEISNSSEVENHGPTNVFS